MDSMAARFNEHCKRRNRQVPGALQTQFRQETSPRKGQIEVGDHVFVRKELYDADEPKQKLAPIADRSFKVISANPGTVVVDIVNSQHERMSRD